jgi:1,4-alpha-glucan branching enzyme
MPYVEGFGTWPFGEEWLWEAIASSYLPLLELLDGGAPLTLSLTPVLCDQLAAPGVGERCLAFLREVRHHTHHEDARGLRAGGHHGLAAEVERSWGDYERAAHRLEGLGGDLLGALAPHAQWTSAATHAVLPLLASDAGLHAQVAGGVESHLARFDPSRETRAVGAGRFGDAGRTGDACQRQASPGFGEASVTLIAPGLGQHWRGGFWLPECAHSASLEWALAQAGVRATCVELTARLGLGAPAHLRPLVGESGVVLVPIDRATMSLVWSDAGYPAHGSYRDYHHHTVHHHQPWANDGSPYDHGLALALAREHAADFVARTLARLERDGAGLPGGGLAVCALDTELLGHWWYEGVAWLAAVVEECARQGLELVRLDDALERIEPAPISEVWRMGEAGGGVEMEGRARDDRNAGEGSRRSAEDEATTWGEGGDLSTWSSPAVADIAFATRSAELRVLAAGPRAGAAAVRELLALQSSDWAFMVARGLAVPYARERFAGHLRALEEALDEGPRASTAALRDLAVRVDPAALLAA